MASSLPDLCDDLGDYIHLLLSNLSFLSEAESDDDDETVSLLSSGPVLMTIPDSVLGLVPSGTKIPLTALWTTYYDIYFFLQFNFDRVSHSVNSPSQIANSLNGSRPLEPGLYSFNRRSIVMYDTVAKSREIVHELTGDEASELFFLDSRDCFLLVV